MIINKLFHHLKIIFQYFIMLHINPQNLSFLTLIGNNTKKKIIYKINKEVKTNIIIHMNTKNLNMNQ